MNVFELRQYTMTPGRRDAFVTLFDSEFADQLEATGCTIVGQFRDLGDPDRFVWVRGHESMASRKTMMHAFYDGDHWKTHRAAANACIADSDNVLLLKPAWPGSGFAADGVRAPPGAAPPDGIVAVNLCHFDAPGSAAFIAEFRSAMPAMESNGAKIVAALVTETAKNNFPRHPIREGEHVFAWFTLLNDADAEGPALPVDMAHRWRCREERMRLQPTARSRLRA